MLGLKWIVLSALIASVVQSMPYYSWDYDITFDTSIKVICTKGRSFLPGAMLHVKQAYDSDEDDFVRSIPVKANQRDGSFRTHIKIPTWGNVNNGHYWYYYYFVNVCEQDTAIRRGDVSYTYFPL